MTSWFALSAIGPDRPGIVADLAELIYECDCNLENSSMTILGSEFAVLLLLTGEGVEVERKLSAACKRLEWEKRLTVFFRPLEGEPVPYSVTRRARPYELHAFGIDKAGIVARMARSLAAHGINISQVSTSTRREPESGAPVYQMKISMDVPETVDVQELRAELDEVGAALNIDVTLTEP